MRRTKRTMMFVCDRRRKDALCAHSGHDGISEKKNILKKIFRPRCKRPTRLGGNRVRGTRDARDGIIYARIATRAINVGSRPRIIYCPPCTRTVRVHTGGGGVVLKHTYDNNNRYF